MTQREQNILDAALLHYKEQELNAESITNVLEVCGHFACGARWMHKTLLNEICSWLDHNTTVSTETIAKLRRTMEE